ncbi:MAG: endonuclease [Salinimicrobium sediminis]|nr:endonuclease [Salinimicrobium sediminis]
MKNTFYLPFLTVLFLLGCSSDDGGDPINPQPEPEPPVVENFYEIPEALDAYYAGVDFNLEGAELYDELAAHTIAKHGTFLEYTQRHDYLYDADEDPNNPDNVILVYTGESRDKREYESGNNSYSPQTFNTEHIYPRSYLENEAEADLHVLRVADKDVNTLRWNYPYIDGEGKYSLKGEAFFPGDEWRGDVARIIMYMNLRYDESFETMGGMDLFLEWNAEDPVSAIEKQRNEVIEDAQGNRNPFIDNPHLATRIWEGPEADNRWDGEAEEPDSQAPTVPQNVTVDEVTFETVSLSWEAATDNEGVAKYNVNVDGEYYTAVSSTSVTVEGLDPGVTYEFTITAADAAGNISDASAAVEGTTNADEEAPSVPQNLKVSNVAVTSVTLTWDASTDNAGIAGYDIYMNGEFYETVETNEYTVAGLTAVTTYSFAVAARDLYDNVSEVSAAVEITTEVATGETGSTDLIISEYTEGFGYNKILEIGNPTSDAIDLSAYSLKKMTNGDPARWGDAYQLQGTLEAGAVLVIANEGADYAGLQADIEINHDIVNFNGNDPVALVKNGEIIDLIGVEGGADFAKDVNMRRKTTITSPSSTFLTDEWVISTDHEDVSGFGEL